MKKFILKLLKIIFVLLVGFIISIFFLSKKQNQSFGDTFAYFKTVVTQIAGFSSDVPVISDSLTDLENMSSFNTTHRYYYEQLNDEAKIIYLKLENNINNLKEENFVIDFNKTFNNLLNESIGQYTLHKSFQSALDAFSHDHPELFYIDISKFLLNTKCVSLGPVNTYYVEIIPKDNKNYLKDNFNSKQEVEHAIKEVENIKNNILASVSNLNTYYKIKYVHDYLANSITYNDSNKNNAYTIYGALVEKNVVCEGYAKAFKYLMNSLNIECILVSGKASSYNSSEDHMWNYIKLNNSWYGVDVTWDDPVNSSSIRHNYFLKGNATFITSHYPNGKISTTGMLFKLPTLSKNNYK